MKEMEDIGSIIGSVVNRMDIDTKLKTSGIFNHWEEIVGEEIAKRSRPEKLVRRILYISVATSTWANELSLMSEKLINRINSFTGEEIVGTLRFKADL